MSEAGVDLESRTRAIGRQLFARVRAHGGGEGPWWDRLLMRLTMRDEAVKAQLFRFIDVLPALRTPAQINAHLREYLAPAAGRLPGPLGAAVGWLPRDGWLGRSVAGLTHANARRMALRFIAADDLPGAINMAERLRRQNLAFTIDLLGEAVLSEAEAVRYQGQYLELIDGLTTAAARWPAVPQLDRSPAGPIPRVNVSVKLSSLYSQFDPIDPAGTSRSVRERLRPILRLARRQGGFVNIDMEQSAYKDATLRIFQEVFTEDEFRDWPDVGIAIQAYLRSCGDDLAALAAWAEQRGTPVWVRLVKGAYWDYESVVAAQNDWPLPVFAHKPATDANYEKQTAFLMEHHALLHPAIASHNVRSLAHALALAEQYGLPPGGFEFQMLYGMAEPIKAALAESGHRVRVYTPFGEFLPGMAYLVRRLLENTSNESFLRAGFLENLPEEQLLMNPLDLLRRPTKTRRDEPPAEVPPFRNEPLSDFSREDVRRKMQETVDGIRFAMPGITYPVNVGERTAESLQEYREARAFTLPPGFYPIIGRNRVGEIDDLRKDLKKEDFAHLNSRRWIESLNPSHQRSVVEWVVCATEQDARDAIAAAKNAFPMWRDTPPADRACLLFKVAAVLREQRFRIAAWEVYETGKQWREADADVAEAIDFCEYYGREMIRLAAPHRRDVPGEENATFYEPRGVAVVIAPWNFPLAILCGMTAAAVVAGNTVVMKPAEQSPVVAAQLMRAFEEAGVPAGVVNYLPGVGEEIGPVLVGSPDVAVVAFTGSRAVGLAIQKMAADVPDGQDHLKRVITELGGKNAVIVDDDADLDEAVHGVVASAFGYAGQKCSACSRAVVLAGVYDAFLARLVEATRSLKVGPAEDPGNFIGPVIDADAQKRILAAIEAGKREARLVYSADLGALADEGYYVPPTIFADVPPASALAREEIFGPVLAVMKAADLTEALALANGTPYALTGGLFSRSPANIARVRREFRVGNLYINRKITGALVDRQPFGGFKLSGTGPKAGGPDYLPQFMVARTVTENTLRHGFAPAAVDEPAMGAGE